MDLRLTADGFLLATSGRLLCPRRLVTSEWPLCPRRLATFEPLPSPRRLETGFGFDCLGDVLTASRSAVFVLGSRAFFFIGLRLALRGELLLAFPELSMSESAQKQDELLMFDRVITDKHQV